MVKFSVNIAQKPLKFHGFHVLKGGIYGQGMLIVDGVKRPVFLSIMDKNTKIES